MASTSHSSRQYEYLDTFLATIPHDSIPQDLASVSRAVDANSSPYPKFIDTALRLASGGPSRPDDTPHLRDAWSEIQASVQRTLHAVHHPSSSSFPSQPSNTKRKHSPSSSPAATQKKPKFEREEGNGQAGDADGNDDDDDAPRLTLHALSATAPVRHKVDITLHVRTLRLAHSTTGAPVARCVCAALTRAFLLPTRARSSGALQWTTLLLAGDKPAPPAPRGAGGKAARGAVAASAAARFELACSVSDSSKASAVPRMTVHASTSTSTSTSAAPSRAASSREAIFTLLSSTISGTPVTLVTVERGVPLAGITAFRGVRETSLWFFDGTGILADARPAEFWALADLARGEAGVRVRTATGRTCSVVLTRLAARENDERDDDDDEAGEGEGEEEETEFQMIDGKEREVILEWVRRHRDAFGIPKAQRGAQERVGMAAEGKRTGKDGEDIGARGDSDSDSDFEASSVSSDGGSPSSGSSSGSGSGSGSGSDADAGSDGASNEEHSPRNKNESEDDGSEHGSQDQEESDEEEVVELDPKHHPLLRAGALPKMSRAAMDAAVGLVVGDLVGQVQVRRGGGAGPGHPTAPNEHEQDDDDEEEDELDD